MKELLRKLGFIGFSLVVLGPSVSGIDANAAFVADCGAMVSSIQTLGSAHSSNDGILESVSISLGKISDTVNVVANSPGSTPAVRAAASTVLDAVTPAFAAVASNSNISAEALSGMATQSGVGAAALDAVVLSTSALPKHLNATVFQNKTASAAVLSSSLTAAVKAANTLKSCAVNSNYNVDHQGNIASGLLYVAQLYNYVANSTSFSAQSDIDVAGQSAISIVAVLDSLASLWGVAGDVSSQVTTAYKVLSDFASYSSLSGYTYNGFATVSTIKKASSAILAYVAKLIGLKSVIQYAAADGSGPGGIKAGPDGNLWVGVRNYGAIATITPSGNYSEITLAADFTGDGIADLVVPRNQSIWFSMQKSKVIASINPTTSAINYHSISGSSNNPGGITVGPDGFIWFAEPAGNKIGKIDPSNGSLTEYAADKPVCITAGPDGNVWFTSVVLNRPLQIPLGVPFPILGMVFSDMSIVINSPGFSFIIPPVPNGAFSPNQQIKLTAQSNKDGSIVVQVPIIPSGFVVYTYVPPVPAKIGKITSSGSITYYTVPGCSSLRDIVTGPDGKLWFIEDRDGKIGSMTTSGTITEYNMPIQFGNGIAVGSDGTIWFAEIYTNIYSLDPTTGSITQFPVSTKSARFGGGIIIGPDGDLWFTDQGQNKIVKLIML